MTVGGLILAGGQGMRMGGVEKGLQPLHGSTMIGHVIARLKPQVDVLAINANRSLAAYRAFGLPVSPDLRADLAGPMAGIEAGLSACSTDFLVAVPCDSPFLPMDLVERLGDAMVRSGASAAYAVTETEQGRQPHPVFCMLRRELLPDLREALDQGERKLGAWLRANGAAQATFSDEMAFRNINTLVELQEFDLR